jgi:predicted RNA-binding protein with TRAM domain
MPYERGGFDRNFPPKPVEVGKEYDVEIQELSRRGEGITRIEGLVVFVPNTKAGDKLRITKAGDKLRIKITNIGRKFAEAEVVGAAEETTETEEAEETE